MSEQLTVKFKQYYSMGNYTRTGNKDSRGVITIDNLLRDASYYGYEMVVEKSESTYNTHKIVKCDSMPLIVGYRLHENFLNVVIPKAKIKLMKVWGE